MIVQPSRKGPPDGIMRAMLELLIDQGPLTLEMLCTALPREPEFYGNWKRARRSNLRLMLRFGWVWFDGRRWDVTDEGYDILQEEAA